MNPLRHLLLVVVLVFAQLATGAHAVGHALNDADALPTHACESCLAAHDLGAALPSLAALAPVVLPRCRPAAQSLKQRVALPAPLARQRAPPRA